MYKNKITYKSLLVIALVLIAAVIMLGVGLAPAPSGAASHREAPLISLDPSADITDFFMFRSYEPGHENNVVLIMDVIPGEEPSSGPNYWNFDPNVRYEFFIDNNQDGRSDIQFNFKFQQEIRGAIEQLDLFLSYLAPITALDGVGSEGLGLRQKYSVTMVKGEKSQKLGQDLIVVPSNIGPRTTPDYEAVLTPQGIYDLGNGIKVYAGQRDDPFYIDLGAIFDTLNLRSPGVDMLSGFNVHTIALEIPASLLTRDGKGPADTAFPVLGAYSATSRRATTVLSEGGKLTTKGNWVQVQRLANPLVNEVIIGTEDKDFWNRTKPIQENLFEEYYTNPRFATALELVFGADANPLFDLRDVFLTYTPGNYSTLSELLRLNLSVAP
ncbi:MAG: DUF4331 domain-containing protein, partial [Nitrospira sp.]|nr:DUF4331 domain-containing protein [Nitrospira sp.]